MKRLYPYTNVVLLREGEAQILFNNNSNVMSVENDILKPILDEIELERYLVNDSDIIDIIANIFINFPKNIKNGTNSYLTIHGDYEPGVKIVSAEKKYLGSEDTMVNDLIIIGRNSKEKTKNIVVTMNEKLATIHSKIKSLCVAIKNTIILQNDVNELNS